MTIYELKQIIRLDISINAKLKQLERLNDLKYIVKTCKYTDNRISLGHYGCNTENTIEKIFILEQKIKRDIDKLIDLRTIAVDIIGNLKSPQKEVMELRYINGLKWEEIAYKLKYSDSAVYKIHCKGLKDFKKVQRTNK